MRYKVKSASDENGTLCYQVFRRTWYGIWTPATPDKFFYLAMANQQMRVLQEANKNASNYILLVTATTTVVFTFLMVIIAKLMGY